MARGFDAPPESRLLEKLREQALEREQVEHEAQNQSDIQAYYRDLNTRREHDGNDHLERE